MVSRGLYLFDGLGSSKTSHFNKKRKSHVFYARKSEKNQKTYRLGDLGKINSKKSIHMKKLVLILTNITLLFSCGNKENETASAEIVTETESTECVNNSESYDNESVSFSNESTSSASSSAWDNLLDEYESMVDSYVKIIKKANNGDMSALSEMQSYLEKAQSVADKIESAGDEISVSQLARFQRIQVKLANAAINIQ